MMRRRDLCWRAAGMVLIVTACAVAVLAYGSASALFALPAALAGLTLAVQGKRVMQAIRATHHGHADTAAAIHLGRRRQGRSGYWPIA